MQFRTYDSERDAKAVHQIWREVGWLEKDKESDMDLYLTGCRAQVAELHDQAECLVLTTDSRLKYLDEDLPCSAITGVTTSHVARKQGLAGRLLARALASDVANGEIITALGMFEQGFYNMLGYGTGCYEHSIRFDPADLVLPSGNPRVPRRIRSSDFEAAHAARLNRRRPHGGMNLIPAILTKFDMKDDDQFGLGYFDGPNGELTHYVWLRAKDAESGPYNVNWMAYRNMAEFMELMGVIRNLGDQVHSVRMEEPAGIQIQDLVRKPFKGREVTRRSRFEASMHAIGYWQARILDLPACLAKTHLPTGEARFNLVLTDPIERLLEDADWRGESGEYIVTLGQESSAESGTDSNLPILEASIGAFTRLWLGVRPATGLAVTDDLSGSPELLERLDWILRLPPPQLGWEF